MPRMTTEARDQILDMLGRRVLAHQARAMVQVNLFLHGVAW